MKLKSLTPKSGTELLLANVNVLVGPNNSGKSQTLRDIHNYFITSNARKVLIQDIKLYDNYSSEYIIDSVENQEAPKDINNSIFKGLNSNLISTHQREININSIKSQIKSGGFLKFLQRQHFGPFFVSHLDASTRLNIASKKESHLPETGISNLLQALYHNKEAIESLQVAFKKSFNMDIVLDYSSLRQLILRIHKDINKIGKIPDDPRDAYPILKGFNSLDDQGDGFKSFTGVVLSLLLSKNRLILLDEPEAFLHPAQARFLGYWIGEFCEKNDIQIIIATHDSNFLSGLIKGNQKTNIFRLDRKKNETKFKQIEHSLLTQLIRSPLLASQRVLETLFNNATIVCEADADRIFYSSISTKIFENQNILFIHAQNKQSIKHVISLLKQIGINCGTIVDIDILNNHHELKNLLDSFSVKGEDLEKILELRQEIDNNYSGLTDESIVSQIQESLGDLLKLIEKSDNHSQNIETSRIELGKILKIKNKWKLLKEKGFEALDNEFQVKFSNLVEITKKYNIHIVPVGVLESWMDLGIKKKNKWIVKAIEKIYNKNIPDNLRIFIETVLKLIEI